MSVAGKKSLILAGLVFMLLGVMAFVTGWYAKIDDRIYCTRFELNLDTGDTRRMKYRMWIPSYEPVRESKLRPYLDEGTLNSPEPAWATVASKIPGGYKSVGRTYGEINSALRNLEAAILSIPLTESEKARIVADLLSAAKAGDKLSAKKLVDNALTLE